MKKVILCITVLVSTLSYTQTNNSKFVYGGEGLVPRSFTVEVKGMDRNELLLKAKAWLDEKFEDSNDVILKNDSKSKTFDDDDVYDDDETGKAKKNEKIRFNGFTDNAICFGRGDNYSCEGVEYIIELRFRDGDYRFKPIKLTYKTASNKKSQKIGLKKHKFYSNDGKIKEGYEKVSSQIETLLNNLNKSLLSYLTNRDQEDEW
ncbi:hypothetical protein [Flavivirga algicola]|uniref:DUF4468 domain-containing protein n=1 Tax=Flavivirga algicola TaxID=2729136 RepID=A0ABX1RU50_9FLAO|nr:hypothetical protein [Flavivirga algicola]NMH87075.1 hypothetical protein [Flavivirga algicola]